MKQILLLITMLLPVVGCVSDQKAAEPPRPKKCVIKGVITKKTDYGKIPEIGATVYAKKQEDIKSINDSLIRGFNLMYFCYIRNIRDEGAWKDRLESMGVHSKADFDSISSIVIGDSHSISGGLSDPITTTVNGNGEYSLHVDSGRYFVLIESSEGTGGYYGRWVDTRDSITDLSRDLWYVR